MSIYICILLIPVINVELPLKSIFSKYGTLKYYDPNQIKN